MDPIPSPFLLFLSKNIHIPTCRFHYSPPGSYSHKFKKENRISLYLALTRSWEHRKQKQQKWTHCTCHLVTELGSHKWVDSKEVLAGRQEWMRMMTAIHMATLLTYSTHNFPFTHHPSCPWILKETAFLHLKLTRKLQPLSFFMGFAMDHPCLCNLEYELSYALKKTPKSQSAW